jgi:DNA topoisomerase-1
VVFNAITKAAVTEAMKNPREVDMELVEAYLARRALDYLVGFNLSPVLWRKLPGREIGGPRAIGLPAPHRRARDGDRGVPPREYWSVRAILETPRGQSFEARLVARRQEARPLRPRRRDRRPSWPCRPSPRAT